MTLRTHQKGQDKVQGTSRKLTQEPNGSRVVVTAEKEEAGWQDLGRGLLLGPARTWPRCLMYILRC